MLTTAALIWTRALLALVVIAAVGACGGDDSDPESAAAEAAAESGASTSAEPTDADEPVEAAPVEPSGEELRPAEEVVEEQNRSAAIDGALGQRQELDDGVFVTVEDITLFPGRVADQEWQPTHIVTVRVENTSGEVGSVPSMAIRCSNYEEDGGWYSSSTVGIGDEMPAGTFREGEVHLAVPEIDGLAVKDCADPVVRVTGGTGFYLDGDEPTSIDFPAPLFGQ
ncbi:MAG: hypothetical protein ACE367_05245 [Acidimicrobiales bacterium]